MKITATAAAAAAALLTVLVTAAPASARPTPPRPHRHTISCPADRTDPRAVAACRVITTRGPVAVVGPPAPPRRSLTAAR